MHSFVVFLDVNKRVKTNKLCVIFTQHDVYSIDTLPDRPRLVVCNTDPSHRPGCHWICICVENGTGEYFDSFGRQPSDVLRHYMNIMCEQWTFNARQLQSIVSRLCGHYCIYYCLLRSRGITMSEIVASFSSCNVTNVFVYFGWELATNSPGRCT